MQRAADRARSLRLYVDADITPKLARTLRAEGHDVVSAHDLGHAEATDQEQMALTPEEMRNNWRNLAEFTAKRLRV